MNCAWGDRLIDSCPPATTIRASPVRMAWAASATARRPEPQTWLTPQAGTSFGTPAAIDAWRGGVWPLAPVSPLAGVNPHASFGPPPPRSRDRESTRLNSSHPQISYDVFFFKQK